jgi:hypothetical protein
MSSQDILLLTPDRPALYTTTRALFPVLLPTSPTAEDVWKEFKKTGQFVSDLQICCHFTTHNSVTTLKTNDETITFLVCLFVLSEQLVTVRTKQPPVSVQLQFSFHNPLHAAFETHRSYVPTLSNYL